tara:strand:- start:8470 stop:8709 length:240 start_codon:yes stop_codon:yes gene_type:complete
MKTQAEKYAEGYRCPATNENEYCKHDIISAYNNGYTQCQEDRAEKKYTEEDMRKVFEYGKTLEPFDCFEDFIESLNKQD